MFLSRSFLCHTLLTCLIMLNIGVAAYAQVQNYSNDSTASPIPGADHNYIGMLSETVRPQYGSLSIRINTPTPSGRLMKLPFSFSYDSNGVFVTDSLGWEGPLGGYLSAGGWSYSIPMLSLQATTQTTQTGHTSYTCDFLTSYILYDSQGTRHSLLSGLIPNGPSGGHCTLPFAGVTPGDHFALYHGPYPAYVASRDGTVYHMFGSIVQDSLTRGQGTDYIPDVIEDSNGNQIHITNSTPPNSPHIRNFTVSDDVGRTLVSSTGIGTNGDTVSIAGLSSPYTLTWATQGVNFSTTWTNTNPPPPPEGCYGVGKTGISSSLSGVSAITLPNGQQYKFSYDQTYGLVNKITYPSGGYVSYQWGLDPQSGIQIVSEKQGSGSSTSVPFSI